MIFTQLIEFPGARALQTTLMLVAGAALVGCAHGGVGDDGNVMRAPAKGLEEIRNPGPIELRLKADLNHPEQVEYISRSRSSSLEDNQLRQQKEESVTFVSQAETLKAEAAKDRFTQSLTIVKKEGTVDLHDFAMPELGESLEVTADSHGRILKAGDYPENSVFYVPPVSLPDGPVSIGDTWTLKAGWLSLEEMIPYQLDMVSILKAVWKCGKDRCAQIEISGDVTLDGPAAQAMSFKSQWRGMIYFDIEAGTVVWSRVDSVEQFAAGNVRRDVDSCLEAALVSPDEEKIPGLAKPSCEWAAAAQAQNGPLN